MKRIISLFLILSLCILTCDITCAKEQGTYENILFEGTEEEKSEIVHLLLAKLVYDDLSGYEGETVEAYVKDKPSLYESEIWEDSLITYEALYSSLLENWQIYKIYDYNTESGLYAVAFKNNNQVVLSFRGSEMFTESFPLDESNDWLGTDFKFAIFNELSEQFKDADMCYEDLCLSLEAEEENCEITFTGHSLGGALVAYQSIMTGCYGYSFDGAVGHILDLVYYYCYLDVYDFSGIDKIKFCNYTDATGYVVADMIQHVYPENMYQIDRETNVEGLNEDDWLSGMLDASSHIIWSYIGHSENKVFLNEMVKGEATPTDAVKSADSYTYLPESPVYMDIDDNVIAYTLNAFDFYFPWNNPLSMDFDYEHMLGSLVGINIDGRVVLGDSSGQSISGCLDLGVSGLFGVDLVMYGGIGDDNLYGYTADDVIISCGGNDFLDGNLGNDTYIIDSCDDTETYIKDFAGEKTTVIFRNMQLLDIKQLTFNSEENVLNAGNQQITLDVGQSYENVELYSYDNGVLKRLGSVADLSYDKNDNMSLEYSYIVVLEGRGIIDITDEEGNEYAFANFNNIDMTEIYHGSYSFGDLYINNKKGSESIMLVLNDKYKVSVSNDAERVDLAVGKYSDEDGVFCCKRRYDRNFSGYDISFEEADLNDGEGGDINWSDILGQDISFIDLILFLFGIK